MLLVYLPERGNSKHASKHWAQIDAVEVRTLCSHVVKMSVLLLLLLCFTSHVFASKPPGKNTLQTLNADFTITCVIVCFLSRTTFVITVKETWKVLFELCVAVNSVNLMLARCHKDTVVCMTTNLKAKISSAVHADRSDSLVVRLAGWSTCCRDKFLRQGRFENFIGCWTLAEIADSLLEETFEQYGLSPGSFGV